MRVINFTKNGVVVRENGTEKSYTKEEWKEKEERRQKADPTKLYINENRLIRDGVYDLTDIEMVSFDIDSVIDGIKVGGWYNPENHDKIQEILNFKSRFPNYVVGHAYQTGTIYFISKEPTKVEHVSGQFNYGANAVITNCPKSVLILAEDD